MPRLLPWLLVLPLVTGCTLKTWYEQLDWVIPQYAEEYVTLDPLQQALLEQRVIHWLHWHRHTQLPAYSDWLAGLNAEVQNGLSRPGLERHARALDQHLQALLDRTADEMAMLLPGLNKKQREELYANLQGKTQDYREKYLEREEAERFEQQQAILEDNLERWLGRLHPPQKRLVASTVRALTAITAPQLATRLRWEEGLRRALEMTGSLEQRQQGVRQHFSNGQQYRDADYQHALDHNRGLILQLIVDVVAVADAGQKTHLARKIADYREMFAELASARQETAARECINC